MADTDLSQDSLALRAPSRIIRRLPGDLYPYPVEDPQSPTMYVLESKRARALKIPLKREGAMRYFLAPGRHRPALPLFYHNLNHPLLAPRVEPLVLLADIPASNSLASHYGQGGIIFSLCIRDRNHFNQCMNSLLSQTSAQSQPFSLQMPRNTHGSRVSVPLGFLSSNFITCFDDVQPAQMSW